MLLSSNQADDKKPDESDSRHAPRNIGLQDLTIILPFSFILRILDPVSSDP
jgi:hypothetical protein